MANINLHRTAIGGIELKHVFTSSDGQRVWVPTKEELVKLGTSAGGIYRTIIDERFSNIKFIKENSDLAYVLMQLVRTGKISLCSPSLLQSLTTELSSKELGLERDSKFFCDSSNNLGYSRDPGIDLWLFVNRLRQEGQSFSQQAALGINEYTPRSQASNWNRTKYIDQNRLVFHLPDHNEDIPLPDRAKRIATLMKYAENCTGAQPSEIFAAPFMTAVYRASCCLVGSVGVMAYYFKPEQDTASRADWGRYWHEVITHLYTDGLIDTSFTGNYLGDDQIDPLVKALSDPEIKIVIPVVDNYPDKYSDHPLDPVRHDFDVIPVFGADGCVKFELAPARDGRHLTDWLDAYEAFMDQGIPIYISDKFARSYLQP